MLFKGVLGTQLSGSINGIVASHNSGGTYFRDRAIPTNPNTPQQATVRQLMSDLVSLWLNTLTAVQRAAWDLYAFNVPLINRLGDPINVSGLNMYCRFNVPYIQAGQTRVDAAPGVFNLGDFTQPSFALDEPNDEVDVTFDNTDDWAGEDDSILAVYASRPQTLSTNFFKGPYRFAGAVEGDAKAPPASPAAIGLPFPVATGQRVFIRVQVARVDGRLSADFRGQADA